MANPTGVQGAHLTAAEREERLREVEQIMLVECNDRRAARRVAQRFGVTKRTGLNYCAEVRAQWRADAEAEGGDRVALRRQYREQFATLYRKNIGKDGSPRIAALALERMAQLDGFLTGKPEAPDTPQESGDDTADSEVATLLRGARERASRGATSAE